MKKPPLNFETIRVWTSIVLTTTGTLIALVLVIFSLVWPNKVNLDQKKWAAAMTLALAGMASGVGLAQSIKSECKVKNQDTDRPNE